MDTIVEEIQGPYGPVSVSESLLQRIWKSQRFLPEHLRLADGRKLQILSPGRWNFQEGPDFLGAELKFGDETIRGDIEVHFHATDWHAHGHRHDPAYRLVQLHVVLFPPGPNDIACKAGDRELPVLVLLPHLPEDLEACALDEAVLAASGRDRGDLARELAGRPLLERRELLRARAAQRWRQKVAHATVRLERLGWEQALHTALLEVLGYRRNRVPMLDLAQAHPLAEWVSPGFSTGVAFTSRADSWRLAGLRPGNHPKLRLAQYQALAQARPDWPARWLGMACPTVSDGLGVASARKAGRLGAWRKQLAQELLAGTWSGPRGDTLVVDALLPLRAARTGEKLFPLWQAWWAGDAPDEVDRFLAEAGVLETAVEPLANGHVQGVFQVFLEDRLDS